MRRDRAYYERERAHFEALVRQHLEPMRLSSYGELAANVARTKHELHEHFDGRTIVVSSQIEWDDELETNLHVMANARFRDGSVIAYDSFIMTPDGSFVDED